MPVVKRILAKFSQRGLEYYDREPVRVQTAVATAVVAAGTAVGLALSAPVVIAVVAFAAPIIISEVRKEVASKATQRRLLATQPLLEDGSRPYDQEAVPPLPAD